MIKNFKEIKTPGHGVDDALVNYVKTNHGMVATIDYKLKMRIKRSGGSIISISNNRIVIES